MVTRALPRATLSLWLSLSLSIVEPSRSQHPKIKRNRLLPKTKNCFGPPSVHLTSCPVAVTLSSLPTHIAEMDDAVLTALISARWLVPSAAQEPRWPWHVEGPMAGSADADDCHPWREP